MLSWLSTFLIYLLTLLNIIQDPNVLHTRSNFSTNMVVMQGMLEKEEQLIQTLEHYSMQMQQKVTSIQRAIVDMRKENEKFKLNPEQYLSNSINSFSLIRRLKLDWEIWINFLDYSGEHDKFFSAMIREVMKQLPTKDDVISAIRSIHRLQVTYDLKPNDMAVGLLNNVQYDVRLSSIDCLSIGTYLYEENLYNDAEQWLHCAWKNFDEAKVFNFVLDFNKSDVAEIYIKNLIWLEKYAKAKEVAEAALKFDPNHFGLIEIDKGLIQVLYTIYSVEENTAPKPEVTLFELGCRGEFMERSPNLHCGYISTSSPFSKLAPFKMEQIYLDPYVVLYHDALTNSEMAAFISQSHSSLKRSEVYLFKGGGISNNRTSKSSIVSSSSDSLVHRINQRIQDMTDLSMFQAEPLQVANYVLGEHFSPHYDFFNDDARSVPELGNRIATLLFYMSNVEQGGATVFPMINITITPQKGSALFWYNMDNRMNSDYRTVHGACPILVGSKWVMTKWIRSKSQLFRRPCYKE